MAEKEKKLKKKAEADKKEWKKKQAKIAEVNEIRKNKMR